MARKQVYAWLTLFGRARGRLPAGEEGISDLGDSSVGGREMVMVMVMVMG